MDGFLALSAILFARIALPVAAVFAALWLASRTEIGQAIVGKLRSPGLDQDAWRD